MGKAFPSPLVLRNARLPILTGTPRAASCAGTRQAKAPQAALFPCRAPYYAHGVLSARTASGADRYYRPPSTVHFPRLSRRKRTRGSCAEPLAVALHLPASHGYVGPCRTSILLAQRVAVCASCRRSARDSLRVVDVRSRHYHGRDSVQPIKGIQRLSLKGTLLRTLPVTVCPVAHGTVCMFSAKQIPCVRHPTP